MSGNIAFQHTAARRRLLIKKLERLLVKGVQHTAARRRLRYSDFVATENFVFTHSRPKAAGHPNTKTPLAHSDSTHN
ncbi:hypothetical protein BV912_13085, partial [Neisseria dumasiana]